MNLIGLIGLKGSGKNTVGQYFVDNHGYTAVSFADCLKDCLSAIFGWDREMLEGATADSREWRETVDEWWAEKLGIPDFTPRKAMTSFGTDVMRNHFHESIWLLTVERKIATIDGPVIITDVRMPNELAMVYKMKGKIYRITRGDDPVWAPTALLARNGDTHSKLSMISLFNVHESEWLLYGEEVDGVITNDTNLDDLYKQCEAIL